MHIILFNAIPARGTLPIYGEQTYPQKCKLKPGERKNKWGNKPANCG